MKHLHYALLPIVALAFASCSEDLEEFESPKAELEGKFYKQFEITADCSFNDPETRAVLWHNDKWVYWEDDDKLIIWTGEARDGGNYTVSRANMGMFTRKPKSSDMFNGYLQDTDREREPADDTPLYAYVASEYIEPVYVTSNKKEMNAETHSYESVTTGFLCVDLSEQKGTMQDAMKHDLFWSTLPYSEFKKNDETPHVQFEHEMAILKYTLTLEGAGTTTANIRLSGNGMAKKINFRINTGKSEPTKSDWENGIECDKVMGDIILKDVKVKNDVATIYVALYPSLYAEMQAYITLADGRRATASVGGNLDEYPIEYRLEAGKIYKASASVTPVEVTAKVGDYYNSDGTYTTTPQSNSVGIVFSTETSARDFAEGYTNGYVMALQNAEDGLTVYWDSKSDDTYVYDEYDGRSPCKKLNCWYYNRDGRLETDLILKYRAEKHGNEGCEAAYAARTYQPTDGYVKPMGASDWYLPSLAQWYEIIKGLAGFTDGDAAWTWRKDDIPYNLARNVNDLDLSLTSSEIYLIWSQNSDVEEQTSSYKFKTNMNKRLEMAEEAGAKVSKIEIIYSPYTDPEMVPFPKQLRFWTTGEQDSDRAKCVLIGTNYNSVEIGIQAVVKYNDERLAERKSLVRPVLAF